MKQYNEKKKHESVEIRLQRQKKKQRAIYDVLKKKIEIEVVFKKALLIHTFLAFHLEISL
jgi:hypothetical protein